MLISTRPILARPISEGPISVKLISEKPISAMYAILNLRPSTKLFCVGSKGLHRSNLPIVRRVALSLMKKPYHQLPLARCLRLILSGGKARSSFFSQSGADLNPGARSCTRSCSFARNDGGRESVIIRSYRAFSEKRTVAPGERYGSSELFTSAAIPVGTLSTSCPQRIHRNRRFPRNWWIKWWIKG